MIASAIAKVVKETNAQIASCQQGRTDSMRAPQHARQAQTAQQPTHMGGPGSSGYPEGAARRG